MKKILLSLTTLLCSIPMLAQWTSDPAENTRVSLLGQHDYGTEVVTNNKGITYVARIIPEGKDADGQSFLSYRLQVLDKAGNRTLPEEGKVISRDRNLSYTTVNQTLLVDKDGNAIIISHDCHNSAPTVNNLGYTVYKVSPDGTMLWGDKGVDLADGEVFQGSAFLKAIQTTDGGYVFSYETYDDASEAPSQVRVEKLTNDGKKAWDDPIVLQDNKVPYSYSYLVDAGDNQVMLVFLQGSNRNIMARMLDFDGSSVWSDDVKLYQGGFDAIPIQTHLKVNKAPDGGAFVTWRDDRNNEGSYSNYISYVKNDGTLGFPGGVNALKISYADDYSRQGPMIAYDEQDKCVYAVYRQYSQALQSWSGIFIQKISMEGELKWGPEGKAVVDIQNSRSLGYATVQMAGGNDIAVFYQTNAQGGGDVKSYAVKYDKEGNALWDKPLEFTTTVSEKNDLLSSELIDGSYWLLNWSDNRGGEDLYANTLYMQRINIDGTLGTPKTTAIDNIENTTDEVYDIYNMQGMYVKTVKGSVNANSGLNRGVYLVKSKAQAKALKVVVE